MNGPTEDAASWKTLEERVLCETPWLRVSESVVATPSRPSGVRWMIARRPTAAVVAPRTPVGGFLLIRQERIPVRRELWEFPAGQIDGEPTPARARETAHRELAEEAGAVCQGELTGLGVFFSSAGFTDECAHLFLASEVVIEPGRARPDSGEAIHEVREFSPDELKQAVASGLICDANSLAVFARLTARRFLE